MKAFNTIRQEIMHTSSRDFEKLCLQLLEHFYPTIEQSEEMQGFDRAGFDLVVRSTDFPYDLEIVFQCKSAQDGFTKAHLKKCLGSIKSFRDSGFVADAYWFILNKPLHDPAFREQLAIALDGLKAEERIKNYNIFDADDFLKYLVKQAMEDLAVRISGNARLFHDKYTIDQNMRFYIGNIPFRAGTQHKVNPVEYLFREVPFYESSQGGKKGECFFLLSEFGFGKTTLLLEFAQRVFQNDDGRGCIFIPVTTLEPEAFTNEDSFLTAVSAVLSPFKPKTDLIDLLNREVMRLFLKGAAPLVLLIDGLDEHKYFKDFTGLKKLFNAVKGLSVSVIFSMRSEYYKERVVDLEAAMKSASVKARKFTLTDWTDQQILDFLRTYKKKNKLNKKQARLYAEFVQTIQKGQYQRQLGDIPKRPLFLTMVLADVISGTMQEGKVTLAELYEKYILYKIRRDIEGSFSESSPDRGIDISGGIVDFCQAIFQVLQRITIYMHFEINNKLTLSNSVSSNWVKDLIKDTPFKHVLDLSLHSVIMPEEEKRELETHLKFAHFSFLEFFFASNLVLNLSDEEHYLELTADGTIFKFASEIALKKWSPAKWASFREMKFENKKGIGYRLQKVHR